MIDMTENDFGVLMRPVMEEDGDWDDNPNFDDTLNDYTEDLLDEYDPTRPEGHSVKSKGVVTSREGNVITLDFNTKCEGEG